MSLVQQILNNSLQEQGSPQPPCCRIRDMRKKVFDASWGVNEQVVVEFAEVSKRSTLQGEPIATCSSHKQLCSHLQGTTWTDLEAVPLMQRQNKTSGLLPGRHGAQRAVVRCLTR